MGDYRLQVAQCCPELSLVRGIRRYPANLGGVCPQGGASKGSQGLTLLALVGFKEPRGFFVS